MNNAVPCPHPDRCGVSSHIAGSDAHTQCMRLNSSLPVHNAPPPPTTLPYITPVAEEPNLEEAYALASNEFKRHELNGDDFCEKYDLDLERAISAQDDVNYELMDEEIERRANEVETEYDLDSEEYEMAQEDLEYLRGDGRVELYDELCLSSYGDAFWENVIDQIGEKMEEVDSPDLTENGYITTPEGETGTYANCLSFDRGWGRTEKIPLKVTDNASEIWNDTCDIYNYTQYMNGEDKEERWATAISIASVYDFDEEKYSENAEKIEAYINAHGFDVGDIYKILTHIN